LPAAGCNISGLFVCWYEKRPPDLPEGLFVVSFILLQTTSLFLVPEIIEAKKAKSRLSYHVIICVGQKYGTILIIQGVLLKNILFLINMVIY
jgi:hypothetical protein